ncbi:SMP-30/gluconolactonase/LRE family protein [Algoriphagus machipongonensis]|uniref:Gluconolactonase n=1 Tax=Algoriphagus machipongonensis TaxID=388413 RepID=A3HYV8_9BACT|nr:SMP-30/gluconolactonase/LRE family protein [Algoriphagus machipongonensis]EAZ80444.1 gluconolactonase [Algoriphagus machipongonensis]
MKPEKPMKNFLILLFGSLLIFSCNSPKTESENSTLDKDKESKTNYQTTGSIERLLPELDGLIPNEAEIEILASGFDWIEGPLWLADQNALLFSDVPQNRIWKWTEKDSLELFLEPSGYLGDEENKREPGSNGLMLDAEGNLILCQHGERQIGKMISSINQPKAEYEILVNTFVGKKFNSPNDLAINEGGAIYFTDPPYGLDPWNTKELDIQGVYQLDFMGNVSLQIDSLARPNGIGLSPDDQHLYIAQSDPKQARYYQYDLDENGNVSAGRMILDVTQLVGMNNPGLPDGLAVHSSGHLFASGPGGILIISPEGKHLGTIKTERATSNCTFDADENYLYMTADMDLLRIQLK